MDELERENKELKDKLAQYENRDWGGRKKHDEKWQASYNEWVRLYEQGMPIMEIVKNTGFSRRTCYRYKSYYEKILAGEREKKEK